MNDLTCLQETLTYARETLARSNARAQTADFERVAIELKRAVKKHGLWNVMAIFPDMLRDIALEQWDDNRDSDYSFAADVIEAVLPAVDLNYGERSAATKRRELLQDVIEELGKVKV